MTDPTDILGDAPEVPEVPDVPETPAEASPADAAASDAPAPTTEADAEEPADDDAKPAPKTKGWIRWWALILALIVFGGIYFGGGAAAGFAVEMGGSKALGAPVDVDWSTLGMLSGSLQYGNLIAMDRTSQLEDGTFERQLFSAEEISCDFSVREAMHGFLVVDEMRVSGAVGRAVRARDGVINIAGVGDPEADRPDAPEGTEEDDWRKKLEEKAKERDFVQDLKDLLERMKEESDANAEEAKNAAANARGDPGDPYAHAEWVRDQRPMVLIKRIIIDRMTFEIEDRVEGLPPTRLTEVTLEIKNLSSAPSLVEEPIEIYFKFQAEPALFNRLVRNTIPVEFESTTRITVESRLTWKDWHIDWTPKLLLEDVKCKARSGESGILGIQGNQFADAVSTIPELRIEDIRIYGPVWNPNVETGDALRKLVVGAIEGMGQQVINVATDRANEEIDRAADRARTEIDEGIDRATEGLDPRLKDTIDKSPLGGVKDGILGGTKDKAKEGTGGVGDALGGGLKKLFGDDDDDDD